MVDGRECWTARAMFVSALTGSRALNGLMAEQSALADPDEALREARSERVSWTRI
jgi:hypothetical protein